MLLLNKLSIRPAAISLAARYCSGMSMSFKTIGTHNGTFHCDEALGCFLLKLINKDAEIVRSRDNSVLDQCDIVIDVGSVYDPSKLRFDHHQKGFEHTMNSLNNELPYNIKLSSAGLIYFHYGRQILEIVIGPQLDKQCAPHLFKKVYESFVQEIDGIDNGVQMYDGEPKYDINTNLSRRVGFLNKKWNQTVGYEEDSSFKKAMELAGHEFVETVRFYHDTWWPARKEVLDSINKRFDVHESGEIMQLAVFVPFIGHLLDLESELKIEPTIKYVLYKDDNWRIRAVPMSKSSFISRVPLLEAWRGFRDEVLVSLGASEGAIFVHSTGFIGGHKSLEGVIDMAVKSLASNKS